MWIELHDTAREHPKIKKLARDLGCDRVRALGHLSAFWLWVLRFAPDGDLGNFDRDDIEDAALWSGEPGAFVDAAIARNLIDLEPNGEMRPHNWNRYAGSLKAAERKRKQRMRDKVSMPDVTGQIVTVTGQSRDGHGNVSRDQTRPDQTRPDPLKKIPKKSPTEFCEISPSDPKKSAKPKTPKPVGWTDENEVEFELLCKAYREHRERKTPGHNESGARIRRAFRDRRQEGYSVDELCDAVHGLFRDAWRKDKPNAQRLELALRSENVPQLIESGRNEGPQTAVEKLQGSRWSEEDRTGPTRSRVVEL